jgi:hypothetical protein
MKGKIIFENGDVLEGSFELQDGNGKLSYENGDVYEGRFDEDIAKNGFGKLTTKKEEVYEGQWKDNQFNGKGKIVKNQNFTIHFYRELLGSYYNKDYKNILLYCENNDRYVQLTINREVKKTFALPSSISNFDDLKNFIKNFSLEIKNITDEEIQRSTCPISLCYMFDAVITSCGHSFSKGSLDRNGDTCPVCRQKILYSYPDSEVLEILKRAEFEANGKKCQSSEVKNIEELKGELENYDFNDDYSSKKREYCRKKKSKSDSSSDYDSEPPRPKKKLCKPKQEEIYLKKKG